MEIENIVEKIIEEIIVFLETPMPPSFSLSISEQELEEPFSYDPQETEEYLREEIFQWIQLYQQEYSLTLSKPSYYQDITQAILEAVYPLWEKEPFIQEFGSEEDIGQIIYEMVCQFCPKRYSLFSPIAPEDPCEYVQAMKTWQQKVQTLQQLDEQNPKQGTTAWLKQRYNMITASDAYKALTTESQRNNIIQSKSLPFHCYGTEDEEGQRQQHHGPASMAWGHMFEPVSVQIYEHLTGEKVLFMGCIPHPLIPYLGASPDGVVSPWETDGGRCQRVQRLLEIKNPISRQIDGIPSEAYWIQQQIQMEVCDMEGCDFFETTFKTMDDLSILFPAFLLPQKEDVSGLSSEMSSDLYPKNNIDDRPPTQDAESNPEPPLYYGVIAEYSYRKWGEPFPSIKRLYLSPFTLLSGNLPEQPLSSEKEEEIFPYLDEEESEEECSIWDLESEESQESNDLHSTGEYHYVIDIKTNEIFNHPNTLQEHIDKQIPKNHPEAPEYKFSKKIYWKLENASLVYVERNRAWFEAAKPKLEEVWQTIQQTREIIESTAPLPQQKQEPDSKTITLSSNSILKKKSLKDWFG
jgi:hypothetical protein